MIDTIVLNLEWRKDFEIMEGCYKLFSPDVANFFKPPYVQFGTRKSVKADRNPTAKDKLNGNYMPQVKPPAVEPLTTSPSVPRLKVMVESILAENPKFRGVEARNSDIALTICLWQRYYSVGTNPDSTIHLYRFFDLPSEAVIGRARRVIQNTEHKYLPNDPRVLIARGILEEYWEEALGYRLTKEEWQRYHKTQAELKQGEQRSLI